MMAAGKHELALTVVAVVSIQWLCHAFTPTDNYVIDCGSSIDTTTGNRIFAADSSLSSTLTTPANILANTTLNPASSSGSSALYQTARVFTGPSSYSFSIQEYVRHLVRLHFFPFVFGSYDLTSATFTVSTQDVVLLNSHRPPANSSSMKEFSLNISRDTLILSFAPSGSTSLAFVNAIEVISVPHDLIVDQAQTVRRKSYQGLSGQALETVYRVNMGGPEVFPDDDTLWRTWQTDPRFLQDGSRSTNQSFSGRINYMEGGATQESAPDMVYATVRELNASNTSSDPLVNMTWKFDVDASFSYLIRFHFCDIVSKAANELYFDVSVGSWIIMKDFDLSSQTSQTLATPCFVDCVLDASDSSNELSVGISHSNLSAVGILNGLEIMKMNFSVGSVIVVTPPDSKKSFAVILGSVIGSIAVVVIAVVVFLVVVLRKRKPESRKRHRGTGVVSSIDELESSGGRTSSGAAFASEKNGNLGYRFPFVVLREATNNFDDDRVIGIGGFGKVYKGVLRDDTRVAVKRGNSKHKQGVKEFHNEIELLSQLRHRHLVSLIGYCDERKEMILVYEYMDMGTLKSHLYGSNLPSLTWKQRLEICIGSARGLHYLHTSSATAIIHRDVKSANILLDENLLAKVADFGLSKAGPALDQTHVSTAVKGSFGYLDPDYIRRQQLTEKSDVYSFGVVLLEVLCARPVIDPTLPGDVVNLAEWGMKWQKKGELEQIADPRIAGTIRPASLRKFGETVEKCLVDYGVDRPSMGDVIWNLEYVLQLQEDDDSSFLEINSMSHIAQLSPVVTSIDPSKAAAAAAAAAARDFDASTITDTSDASMDKVFSQLISSEGR